MDFDESLIVDNPQNCNPALRIKYSVDGDVRIIERTLNLVRSNPTVEDIIDEICDLPEQVSGDPDHSEEEPQVLAVEVGFVETRPANTA